MENLRKEVNKLGLLENYPGEKLTGREFRRKRDVYEDSSEVGVDEDYDFTEDLSENDDEFGPGFGGGGYCTKTPRELH